VRIGSSDELAMFLSLLYINSLSRSRLTTLNLARVTTLGNANQRRVFPVIIMTGNSDGEVIAPVGQAGAPPAPLLHCLGGIPEERFYLKKYGDAYREYMNRTPRWIGIPKY